MRTLKPANTQTFEHTITGLLAKRANLFREVIGLRDCLAEIKNDVAAIDRILGTFGYKGDPKPTCPAKGRRRYSGAAISGGLLWTRCGRGAATHNAGDRGGSGAN